MENTVVNDNQFEALKKDFISLLERYYDKIIQSPDPDVSKYKPSVVSTRNCCFMCGINHKGRDLLHCLLLNMENMIEDSDEYQEFLTRKDLYYKRPK